MRAEDSRTQSTVSADDSPRQGSGLLVRLGWMVGTTLTMLITGFVILSTPTWTFGVSDAVYWGGALGAVALRYLDIKRYDGETSNGEPATMAHFARYTVALVGSAVAFWTIAQSVHL